MSTADDEVETRTQEMPVKGPRAAGARKLAYAGPATQHSPDERADGPAKAEPPKLGARAMFFDGSYLYEGNEGQKSRTLKHSSFFSNIPRWRYVYNTALIVLDEVMMLLTCTLVILFRPDIARATTSLPGGVPGTVATFCAVWLIAMLVMHSYRRHLMGEGYALYAKILTVAVVNFIALCSVGYFFGVPYPRWLVTLASLLAGLFTLVERWLMRRLLHHNRRHGEYNYPTVIIGSPRGIHETIDKLTSPSGLSVGYAPVAVCPIAAVDHESDPDAAQYLVSVPFRPRNKREQDLRVLKLNSRLPQTAKYLGAQTVFVADVLTLESETMRTLTLAVEALNMELAVAASVADIGGGRLTLRHNSDMPVLSASLPQYSWTTRFLKRTMDIIGSLIALIPSAILILVFGLATKLEDGGPIFYKQERIGLYGKPFNVLKLRSMRVDADKHDAEVAAAAGVKLGATFKVKDDPRITKVGRFIRKTSIDEVPQFINVLRGDMSLVGPRPQRQYEVDQYSSLYSTRLLVRPGITGPWQIGGRNNLSQEEAEVLDVSYVENWSLMTDIAILIKTVGVVLRGDGAY